MGHSSSKVTSEDLCGFNVEEYKILEANLKPFVVSRDSGHSTVDSTALKKVLEKSHLSTTITGKLCRVYQQDSTSSHKHKTSDSNWKSLLTFLSKILRGNSEELSEVIIRLANDTEQSDSVSTKQLFAFLCEICHCYYKMIEDTPPAKSWNIKQRSQQLLKSDAEKLVHNQLQQLIYKGKDVKDTSCETIASLPDGLYLKEDIEKWLTKTPTMLNILETVFDIAFQLKSNTDINYEEPESYTELLPMCHDFDWKRFQPIVTPSDVLILNQSLPARLRNRWRLLFSSSQHGESFSQLLGRFSNQGPTLLVVRDQYGVPFGGFASESWTIKPQFAGTSECFLFKLQPNVGIYNSTGFNQHFMYLNLYQQTMPNGLGMGGQLEYFGLWLDCEYGLGKCSKSCTTYCSPQLSSTEDFKFAEMEVWGVGPLAKSEDDDEGKLRPKKSILDKLDPGLKTVMEMSGRQLKSEAVRKQDEQAERERNAK